MYFGYSGYFGFGINFQYYEDPYFLLFGDKLTFITDMPYIMGKCEYHHKFVLVHNTTHFILQLLGALDHIFDLVVLLVLHFVRARN